MTADQFIDRLLLKRPVTFMNPEDVYRLRDGTTGRGGFDKIGSTDETAPLCLADYLSYDEMKIAALLSTGGPVHFINTGARDNRGEPTPSETYIKTGICYGLVGARFEKEYHMEWEHMVISTYKHNAEFGYGPDANMQDHKNIPLKFWANYYDVAYFPTFEQAKQDTSGNFLKIDNTTYLNVPVYKERMRRIIEPFLLDANARAQEMQQQAYVHTVGLGLGVWMLTEQQGQLLVDVFKETARTNRLDWISDIDFSYFPEGCQITTTSSDRILFHFSKRNPADPLPPQDSNKLLILNYPADANSFSGNEYWFAPEYLAASGEAACACASTTSEMHNPEINTTIRSSFKVISP
jgi:hypothetical protein